MKICALLTCFNRQEKTAQCLSGVQDLFDEIDIYLVDDGSTDKTREIAESIIRHGKVIVGAGNLFWSRGMALAWREAAKVNSYQYYLWLNDDIILRPNAVSELLDCAQRHGNRAVITGLIADAATGETIYGGSDRDGKLLEANGEMQQVISMNGNCVLVSREIFEAIGTIDPLFHHDLGDVDYGMRAIKAGFKVLTTRNVVADGYKNLFCRVRRPGKSLKQRFAALYSPLGNPPLINFRFRLRHKGLANAASYFVFIHALNFMPDKLVQSFFGSKYD